MAEKVAPLEFNPHTDDLLPNIVVSDSSSVFVPDKKANKAMNKFFNANPGLNELIFYLRTTIIQNKPDDILDFIVTEIFSAENIPELTKKYSSF